MKIYHRNATLFLLEKLHTIRYFHSSWRAIHLKLAGKKERHNRTLLAHFILKGLTDLLAEDDGYVYFCKDGDIVILFEGRVSPIIKKLAGYFADIDPRYSDDKFDRYFTTYDLSREWAMFSGMCHLKSIDTESWERPLKTPPASHFPLEEAPGL